MTAYLSVVVVGFVAVGFEKSGGDDNSSSSSVAVDCYCCRRCFSSLPTTIIYCLCLLCVLWRVSPFSFELCAGSSSCPKKKKKKKEKKFRLFFCLLVVCSLLFLGGGDLLLLLRVKFLETLF